jgi:tetratricopeptide (TPR) repeat protein
LIKKGVELHPGNSSFHLKLGDAYYAQSDITRAITEYRTASRLLPESEEMHAPLVRSLEETGGLDAVIAEYRDAIIRNPGSSINHVRLGKKLREQGNREEARVAFERAIDLQPDHSIAPYVQLALLHGEQGQGKGDVGVRMILDRYPNSHLAYDYAARSLVAEPATTEHQPNYEHAVQWARRACDLKPDEGRYWNTLGIALYRQGKWREAADTIEESQKRADLKVLSNAMFLTMASWNLGEKERARNAFHAIPAKALAGSNQEQHGFFIELQHLLGREGLEFMAFAGEDSEFAAGALADLLTQQWSSQNWPSLSVQLGHENEADGINLLADPGDGLTEPRFIEGHECRVILKTMAVGHAYFSIDSKWKSAAGMDAEVTVEYWEDGSGSFALQYDAYEHAYRPCSRKIAIGGSWTWRKATFQLNNARFANSQNGQADFRITTLGNGLHVRRVSLQRIQPATEPGDSWGKLAAAYHLTGDKTALARLLKDHPLAEVSLGDSYLENRNWQQAIDVYERLINDETANTNLLNHLAQASNGRAWELVTTQDADGGDRDVKEALNLAKKACELDSNNGQYWKTLGGAYYRNTQWKDAIESLEQSVELGVDDPCNWLFLAMACHQLADGSQARVWYDKAVAWSEQNSLDTETASFYDEAEELLKTERIAAPLNKVPERPELKTQHANRLAMEGRWEEATQAFSKVVESDKAEPGQLADDDVPAYLVFLAKTGDVKRYHAACTELLVTLADAKLPETAERAAKSCLVIPPTSDNLPRIVALAEKAVTLQPTSPIMAYAECVRGLAAYRDGKHQDAIDWSQRCLSRPDSSTVWFRTAQAHLVVAMAQARLKQFEQAKDAFNKAETIIENQRAIHRRNGAYADWKDWLIAESLKQEAMTLLADR